MYTQVLIEHDNFVLMLNYYRWLTEHRSCPTCRSPITADDLRPIHRIWREKLVNLRMKCKNTQHGCTAEITLEELPGHLNTCQYALVACPHDSCPEVVMRKMLDEHMTTCQYRKLLCEECGLEFLATEIAEHKCITSLREYMMEQIEAAKRETLAECMKMVRKERRHYESLLQEQKKNVEDLRRTLSNLLSHQRMHDKLSSGGSNIHQPRNPPSLPRGASANPPPIIEEQQTSNGRKLSLPRLAPLHTHMNLSRSSGGNYVMLT